MLDVLKVRLYPNKTQQEALAKNFGCSRFVDSKSLQQLIEKGWIKLGTRVKIID